MPSSTLPGRLESMTDDNVYDLNDARIRGGHLNPLLEDGKEVILEITESIKGDRTFDVRFSNVDIDNASEQAHLVDLLFDVMSELFVKLDKVGKAPFEAIIVHRDGKVGILAASDAELKHTAEIIRMNQSPTELGSEKAIYTWPSKLVGVFWEDGSLSACAASADEARALIREEVNRRLASGPPGSASRTYTDDEALAVLEEDLKPDPSKSMTFFEMQG